MTHSVPSTDTDLLLAILTDAGNWASHDFILSKARYLTGHGLTVHSRASDLRKQGHNVECDVRRVNGRALSYYRLVREQLPVAEPGPAEVAASSPVGSAADWAARAGASLTLFDQRKGT